MILRNEIITANTVYTNLINSINNVYNDIMQYNEINNITHPIEYNLFNNPHRVVDGPWYVI